MKMKDVINKTDLTDRAIRLYIENGLVSPSCSESYAGRKNIEFSEEDVTALKNIATLRKAGFSISEIKLLKEGSAPCRKTLEEFIEKTTQKIESDKAVIEKLEAVVTAEELTIETICESLNSVTEEKTVPKEDTVMTVAEKIWHYFSRIASVAGIVYFILSVILQIFVFYKYSMRYPVFEVPFYVKWAMILYILGVAMLLLFNRKLPKISLTFKTKGDGVSFNMTKIITLILCIILIPVCFFSYLYNLSTILGPDMHSETTNLDNYLKIDKRIERFADEINEFFPKELEKSEKDFEIFDKKLFSYKDYREGYNYFYRYKLVYDRDKDFTIVLNRYYLSPSELEEEIEKYTKMRPAGCEDITIKQQRRWTMIYYCDTGETPNDYYGGYMYKIFAYNDYGQVRYIMEYNAGSPVGYYTIPYHINMHW